MIIKIKLYNNREVEYKYTIVGKTYENEATALHFDLTEEMINKDFYLDFEKPDGTKYSTPKLEIKMDDTEILKTHGTVEYAIPNSLLDIKGNLKCEVVLRKNGETWKSHTLKFIIYESINADEEIPKKYPDFVSEAQKVIDLIEIDGDGKKYLSNDGTYKAVVGGVDDYKDLSNKPKINNIELLDNKTLDDLGIQVKGNYITTETDPTVPAWAKALNKPSYTYGEISDTPTLATVATSGSYNDLTNTPSLDNFENITNKVTAIDETSTDAQYCSALSIKKYVDETINNAIRETLEVEY